MNETYQLNEKVVVYFSGFSLSNRIPSIGEVIKITPSGRIHVTIPNLCKDVWIFNPDGYERGLHGYNRTRVGKLTEELSNKIEKENLIAKLQSLFRTNGEGKSQAHDLPLNYLQRMFELFGAAKSDSA